MGRPKKQKLSPEEKKQLKALKKIEKKRIAEQKKQELKYDHLGRELRYGDLTVKRHEKKWRAMLLKIAVPRMRIELEYAWHNFERVIDAKDFIISMMMDQIKDAEEQYQMNIRAHTETVDNLILLFKEQLTGLRDENKNDLKELDTAAVTETDKITANHAESEEFLKTMLYGLEMARKRLEIDGRGEMIGKIESEIAKNLDALLKMKDALILTFTKIWNNAHDFLTEYTARTAERRKAYLKLSTQDESVQVLLVARLAKILRFYTKLKGLREQYTTMQLIQGQKLSDLLHERQFYADAFWNLRTKLESERVLDNKHLTLLAVSSNESMDHLASIEKKGERILELAAICRKLETQREKVLPFPKTMDLDAISSHGARMSMAAPHNQAGVGMYTSSRSELVDLKWFWRKVAQADSSRYGINEEREFLKRENRRLLQRIHEYCECLDCPAVRGTASVKVYGVNKMDLNLDVKKYDQYLDLPKKTSK